MTAKTDSIKQNIIRYLEENRGYQWGGTLSREVRERTDNKHKESIIERRARELNEAGLIEKTYEQVNGVGPRCVMYKIKEEPEPIPQPLPQPALNPLDYQTKMELV